MWRTIFQSGDLHLTPQPRNVVVKRRRSVIKWSGTTPDTRQRCEEMCTAKVDCVAYDYAGSPNRYEPSCIADAASQSCFWGLCVT